MFYELWNLQTRNRIGEWNTKQQAASNAKALCNLNPTVYPADLGYAEVEEGDNGATTWLAVEDLIKTAV